MGGGRLRRPPPFVESFMDGCGKAVEAAEAAEAAKTQADAYETSEPLGPELCI